jgi:hypothetical protein
LSDSDRFIDDYLVFIEGAGLRSGGGCGPDDLDMFIERYRSVSRYRWKQEHCTDADRQAVNEYLTKVGAKNVVIGPLERSW